MIIMFFFSKYKLLLMKSVLPDKHLRLSINK
jgi:hypothetical protein